MQQEQTPLMKLISELDKAKKVVESCMYRNDEIERKLETYTAIIDLAKALIPEERNAIEEAHNDATENYQKGYPTPILDGAVYFESKFKQG